jgi:hypothetical protein
VKHFIFLLFITIISLTGSRTVAQQAVLTSGGNAGGDAGTVSYSVGQMIYSFKTGTGGSIFEGLEQPYEILIPIGIETKEMTMECTLFPNPVSRNVTLRIEKDAPGQTQYFLYSMMGALLLQSEVISQETLIHMEDLEKGTYFLRITASDNTNKTFYIIKK